MPKLVKPDFAARRAFKGAPGANADFLHRQVQNELRQVVKESALDPAQQKKLVAYANELAQMPEGQTETNADQRDQINRIASEAEKLLESLRNLTIETTSTLRIYADEACVVPPSPLSADMTDLMRKIGPADFMSQTWDFVEALKAVAEHASEQMALLASKNGKPLESRQRGMIASLAARHYQMSGEYPPKSEGAWFARFARVLGGVMGLHYEDGNANPIDGKPFIGGRLPGTGIKQANTPYFDEEEKQAIALGIANEAARAQRLQDLANCEHDWPRPEGFKGPQTCWKCGAKRGGRAGRSIRH